MRLKTRTWFIISVLCFLGAAYFWRLGDQHALRQSQAESSATGPGSPSDAGGKSPEPKTPGTNTLTNAPQSAAALSNRFPYRLSNTTKSLEQLMHSETALMLQNALLDTSEPMSLSIPAHLRAEGEVDSYVVQAKGTITEAFREQLKQAGAQIVAYVPHNAYLVQVNAAGAAQLRAFAGVQTVMAWEPYYKLDPKLLAKAVNQEPMAAGSLINVLVFPGQQDAARQEIARVGARVLGSDRSPFGTQFTIHMPEDRLVAIAKMASVQIVEPHYRRAPANDLGRVRLNVAEDGVTASNYRGLSGQGVRVNLNDTGVNTTHPDLPASRVTGLGANGDADGHGTHVAGTIAGSGAAGPISPTPPGSTNGANYRGMAPQASLYVLPIDVYTGPLNADTYLQETAALNDGDLSNNSWGYPGAFGYNSQAASWDAAVRDSLPGKPGEQPMLYVFAAGNSGGGNQDGYGGSLDSLTAPATAKNVIAVGAIESLREITNAVVVNGETNTPFFGATDSSRQVASFSSRGNVGFGLEGNNGRFKPDVVAPGTFVISANSGSGNQTNYYVSFLASQTLRAGETNLSVVFAPDNSVSLSIRVLTNNFSPRPMPDLQILVKQGDVPGEVDFVGLNQITMPVVPPDLYFYSLANTNTIDVRYDLVVIIAATNADPVYSQALAALNSTVGPWYRYESGTSMAAPMVSGMVALMQEFFHSRGETNSPALMKALVINGARSLLGYDLNVNALINHQGWGLANITNSIPMNIATKGTGSGSLVYFDQDQTNALATGKSQTRNVSISGNATNYPLRFTLVWTDPPGNPAVGVKLVNDLDLIVTNLTTGEYFVGNEIGGGAIFTAPHATTNNLFTFDMVNNVENIFIGRPGTQYSVTVRARRVNVNAVHSHPDGVVQDYALVISSDGGEAGAVTVSPSVVPLDNDPNPFVIAYTNVVPTLNFRVGANSPLLNSTNGVTNQWTFFVYTNAPTNNYLAFVTFLSPNLSLPRLTEADIDMFVSTNPAITNLDPAVLFDTNTLRSLGRGGSEYVILTNNGAPGPYYVGIKSEDQQAASFGFAAIASPDPFANKDEFGNVYVRGYPIDIPDGSDIDPGGQLIMAINPEQITIENVVVTNTITHELGGDLFGQLSHNGTNAVLNNHYSFEGTKMFVWDDSDSGEILISQPSDGLPTLRAFVGEEGQGVWTLTEIDNSLFATGRVENLIIQLRPQETNLFNDTGITRTIQPNRWFYTFADVPADATNLQVCVAPQGLPVEVYIRRGDFPDQANFDAFGSFAPPGGCLNLTPWGSPPLVAGRYYIGVYNPNSQPVTVNIKAKVERDLRGALSFKYRSGGTNAILDDAKTNFTLHVPRRQLVQDVKVGLRVDHERASDLVFHLTSPSGSRVLLAENRDWLKGSNYGAGYIQKLNLNPRAANGTTAPDTNNIAVGVNQGSIQIDYDFQQIEDRMEIFYDGRLIYDTGLISGSNSFLVDFGPGNGTNVVIVMNRQGGNAGTAWSYTPTIFAGRYVYANFTEDTNYAVVPIKYGTAPFVDSGYTNVVPYGLPILSDGFERAAPRTYIPSEIASGWLVSTFPVNVVTPGFGLARLPYSGLNALSLRQGVVTTNVGTVTSNLYLLNFAYTPSPSARPVNSMVATGAMQVRYGTNLVNIGATTTNAFTNLTWATTSFVFTASSSNTAVQFLGQNVSGSQTSESMLIDAVTIVPLIVASNFWLPEEPMKAFKGEPAFGDWSLEVWDNRLGAGTSNALLSWQLEMTFVNTNPPVIVLTNGQCYTGTVANAGMSLFAVNAPYLATYATNRLFTLTPGGRLNLIYNSGAVPVRDPAAGDYWLLTNTANGIGLVSTNFGASMTPGGAIISQTNIISFTPGLRYYLGVENTDPDSTNTFVLCVDFDKYDTNLLNLVVLTNRICYTNFIDPTNRLQYYAFDASPLAITNIFETLGTNGDLRLVVRHGLPLPNVTSFDFITNGPNQQIILDTNMATLPGRWYLGVANLGSNTTMYCIQATEISGFQAIPLTNMVSYSNTVHTPGGPPGFTNDVDYYTFTVPTNAYQVDVQTFGANGDVNLYVRTCEATPPPGPTNYFYQSVTAGNADELVTIITNTPTPPQPLTPGEWCVAVVNVSGVDVDYNIVVTIYTNQTIIPLQSAQSFTNIAGTTNGFNVNYYSFDVTTNAMEVLFEVIQMAGNVDLYVNLASDGLPGPTNANSIASLSGGTVAELLHYYTNAVSPAPALVKPATYYLGVWNQETTNVSYVVRATEIPLPTIIRLTNNIPYPNNAAFANSLPAPATTNGGVDYYVFTVSSNTIQAGFETFGANGNVDLYITKGLPLPSETNFLASSTNGGATNELIRLSSGTTPALSPGDWYLAVVKREAYAVTYQIRASEVPSSSIVRLTNCVTYSTNLLSSNSIPGGGIHYYVYTVGSNSVQANFEVFTNGLAPGNVDLYITKGLPLPNAASYMYASQNPGTMSEFIAVTNNAAVNPLTPGDWYIAVVNPTANAVPITYGVRVTEIGEGLPTLIRLTDAVPYTSVVASNRIWNNGKMDYYVFTVPATGPDGVRFSIERTNAVTMVVHKGLPLPTAINADYTVAGNTNAAIVVTTNSTVPFGPGEWYVGVFQSAAAAGTFNYTVTASLVTNPAPVMLTNCSPVAGTVLAGGTALYQFGVPTNAVQANFRVLNLTGDVDMYLRRVLPVGPGAFTYASTNAGLVPEAIAVTNTVPNPLPGTWYLAVVNKGAVAANYTVEAAGLTLGTNIAALTSGVWSTNAVTPYSGSACEVDYYRFTVPTNATWAVFETRLLGSTGQLGLLLGKGLPLPGPAQYQYAVTNGLNSSNASLTVMTNSSPVRLSPGDWYIGVINANPTNALVNYEVRASFFTNRIPVGLTNCVNYNTTLAAGGVDYYSFTISNNTVQADFSVLNLTGNVDLYITMRGQGLPGPQNHIYASTNNGAIAELISLVQGAVTRTLVPGVWDVAVVNKTAGSVGYTMRVEQWIPNQNVVRLNNGVAYNNLASATGVVNNCWLDYFWFPASSNAARLTFEVFNINGAGVSLFVRKGLPLPDTIKYQFSSINTSTNAEYISLLETPSLELEGDWYLCVAHFNSLPVTYQVRATEYAEPGTNVTAVGAQVVSTNLCITWANTLPGVRYHVQANTTLGTTNWVNLLPTYIAPGTSLTTCVPLSTTNRFYRLSDGPAP